MHNDRLTTTLLLALVLSLGLTGICYGQAGDTSKGTLSVDVLDASRAIVQGATIKLSGPAGDSTATTNERGEAVFYSLAPGTYSVRAEAKGFRTTEIPGQIVSANRRTAVQVNLEVGAVTETVVVSETAITMDMNYDDHRHQLVAEHILEPAGDA